jgi:hypothetical protein
MSTASSVSRSEAGGVGATPVFVTRERRRRSLRGALPKLVGLVAAMAVAAWAMPEDVPRAVALALGLLALPLLLRLRPRTLEVHTDHIVLVRGSARERISLLELTGLSVRPHASNGGRDWSEVVRLTTLTLRLDLADLEDGPGAWRALERYILPALARANVERLEKGRDVQLGQVRAISEGVELGPNLVPWDHLGPVALQPDGVLLQVLERPDLAVCLPASSVPGAPLLGMIQRGWLGRPPSGTEPAELPAPRTTRRFPEVHPELGPLLFTRLRPPAPKLAKVLWGLSLLALAGGGVAVAQEVAGPQGLPPATWLGPGFVLAMVAFVAGKLVGPPRGAEFAAYRGGIKVAGGAIPWDGVLGLTLADKTASGARVPVREVVLEGEHLRAALLLAGGAGQAFVEWFRGDLAARMARRDLLRIQSGETVVYPHASVNRAGLVVGDRAVAWEELIGVAVEGGATQVVRSGDREPLLVVPESSPNAAVFTRVVQVWMADQARSDAETSAVAEAAALAAAMSVAGSVE